MYSYNLYLVLEGLVNGRILINTFPNPSSCLSSLLGVVQAWPSSLPSGTDVSLVCQKVATLTL
jgi:hypothetical protein